MYEQGWGRVMTFILGFSSDEVCDVTPRYVKNWDDVKERRSSKNENELSELLEGINISIAINLSEDEVKLLEKRQEKEKKELNDMMCNKEKEILEEEMKGRQSGSVEWRKERGEI